MGLRSCSLHVDAGAVRLARLCGPVGDVGSVAVMTFRDEPFGDDKAIVTIDGSPIGTPLPRYDAAVVAHWLAVHFDNAVKRAAVFSIQDP